MGVVGMIKISDLKKLGISEFVINVKVSTGELELVDDSVRVIGDYLYNEIFYRCLGNKELYSELVCCVDDFELRLYYQGIYELIYGDFKIGKRLINKCDLETSELENIRSIINYDGVSNVYPKYPEYLYKFVNF